AEHARALLAHARVEELCMDAIRVHVGEPGARLEVPAPDALVGEAHRTEAEVARAGGRHESDRADALAAVERPHVALRGVLEPGRSLAQTGPHPRLPDVGRLVDVGVGIDDRVVDARDLAEPLCALGWSVRAVSSTRGRRRGKAAPE